MEDAPASLERSSSSPSGFRTLVLKEEVGAADADLVAVHEGGDAVRHDVADLGVELVLVHEAAGLRLGHDGARHAVGEVLLDACREAQKLVLGRAGAADHAAHRGGGVGQGARLVEDDGVGRGQGLEVLASAHGHAAARGLVHRAHHGDGRGELDCARVVDHEDGHGLVEVARQREDAEEREEAVRDKAIGQALGARLGTRLELTRLLDEGRDAIDARASRGRGDEDLEIAVGKRRAGIDRAAFLFAHEGGLARHRGLVDLSLALGDRSVNGKDLARAQAEHHAAADILGADAHVLAVDDRPDALGAHNQPATQREVRARLHVILHKRAELQKEADGARLRELTAQARGDDGGGVEHLDGDLAGEQVAQPLGGIADGAQAGEHGAHRHGEEHALGRAPEHELAHLDLEAVVLEADLERTGGVVQADLGGRQGEGVEAADGREDRLAGGRLERDENGAGRRMDLGGAHTVEVHEQVRDAAGLGLGKEVAAAAQADPSGELRRDVEDHVLTPRRPRRRPWR